jgi:iron complex transport system substrate-binding protein
MRVKLLLLVCLFFLASGCMQSARVTPAANVAAPGTAFTITNYDSSMHEHTYTYSKHPQRIVALWQNSIETIIALGAADKIIAAAGVYNEKHLHPAYLDAYQRIPVKSRQIFAQEQVLVMQPDFIAGWLFDFTGKGRSVGTSSFWEERGVNVYMNLMNGAEFKAEHTIDDELRYINDLGEIVDAKAQAHNLTRQITSKLQNEKQELQKYPRLKVLIISSLGRVLSIYTPRTLPGNIVTALGAEVMGKDNESVGENEYISYEEIVANQPDVIFLQCTPETEKIILQTINNMPALRNIPCVRSKQVYCIPFYTIRSPGIRISDAIDIFSQGLKQAAAQKAATASKTSL